MVRSGQVELAVVTLNPDDTDLDADLKANCIWRDPLVFVSSASEPLATTLHISHQNAEDAHSEIQIIIKAYRAATGRQKSPLFDPRVSL